VADGEPREEELVRGDLALHVESLPLVDSHEHLRSEVEWVEAGPDILQDLLGGYVRADLLTAGAAPEAVERLLDPAAGDLHERFEPVRAAWEATKLTGYGSAVRLTAEHVYGLSELTSEGLESAQSKLLTLRRPGERLRLLRDVAGLDHVQIDDLRWACDPDVSDPGFFLSDISWASFCNGELELEALASETGIEVRDVPTLREAMAELFERHGPRAIAVKAQHAYTRTLLWQERSEAEASRALRAALAGGIVEESVRLCLGDWCWARGVELAIEHDLPFKIHTGYLAGTGRMPIDRVRAGNLCALLARYPGARFVLMHIGYPYTDELVAIAKHYPNVWVDLCWAWSIDPLGAAAFFRRFLHAVPTTKLFAFGGDTFWPTTSLGYALQARQWLARALTPEIEAGDLTETQAMRVATRVMRDNAYACFDVEGTRDALAAEVSAGR
jgi:uncharacterized protein